MNTEPDNPDPRTSSGRVRIVVTMLGLAWLALAGRLIQLQWLQREKFAGKAEQQRRMTEEIGARPGDILDRQGRMLATTLTARSLYIIPADIREPEVVAPLLADAVGVNSDDLLDRIKANPERQFLWVKRRLSEAEIEKFKRIIQSKIPAANEPSLKKKKEADRQLILPKHVWGFRDEYRREYPQGVVAAHVIGLRDIDNVGRGGIEESFDQLLRGQSGQRHVARDSRGHVIEILDDDLQIPVPGQKVRLTIDVVVQLYAERELDNVMREWKPESCSAIVLDPQNGDVLAMATRPTFDPNMPQDATPESWKNRAIADIYEPGSTFKPMIVSYGLDQGVLRRDDMFNCENGEYRMGKRVLHDHHRYGNLNLTDVLVKSSNIGMAKIGERMENSRLFEAATLFGFGRKTGVELPGELAGILRPLKDWTSYSTGSIPMGHEIATTPLQLISAHAALANGGMLVRPRVILPDDRRLTNDAITTNATTVTGDTVRWVIEHPMQEVVTRGTGKKARIPGFKVFGKTGTAQCLSPEGGYVHGKYISSFVCGAPVESPRLLVLVVVNQSSVGGETFGGRVAAPAAANILRQSLIYLRISPDEQLLRAAANLKEEVE